jgi:hypothetical protein
MGFKKSPLKKTQRRKTHMRWLKTILSMALLAMICMSSSFACPTGCESSTGQKTVTAGSSVTVSTAAETGVTHTWTLLDKGGAPHATLWSIDADSHTFTAPSLVGTYYLKLTSSKDGYTDCLADSCIWLNVVLDCPEFAVNYCVGGSPTTADIGDGYTAGAGVTSWLWQYSINNGASWQSAGSAATPSLSWGSLSVGVHDMKLLIYQGGLTPAKTCMFPDSITVVAKPPAPTISCDTGCT